MKLSMDVLNYVDWCFISSLQNIELRPHVKDRDRDEWDRGNKANPWPHGILRSTHAELSLLREQIKI